MITARAILVSGTVQGVGFRPFICRLANENALTGWVQNDPSGVAIHLEGEEGKITRFLSRLRAVPPAAEIAAVDVQKAEPSGFRDFEIRCSELGARSTARISPDLAICEACLREMRQPGGRRYRYPYINCTDCGPRYSITLGIPYDRERTTMRAWPMDEFCRHEYEDVEDRRFHAQPLACPTCGPHYTLNGASGWETVVKGAEMLASGSVLAIKGIGGYHLACNARAAAAVQRLRDAKFRKEQPFALMARDLDEVRRIADVTATEEKLLCSAARPIVLLERIVDLPGIAPDAREFGVMLPYAPLHHLLFDASAPPLLVMTSANRSSEPIAFEDEDAQARLAGIADAFLVGERPIARRVDDSIARVTGMGPMILRRSRGYAPGAVTTIPTGQPILALGSDLKSAVTLVIDGQAFVSQHIGDLSNYKSREAFEQTIHDITSMYGVELRDAILVHDAHPEHYSTSYALELPASRKIAVQHHRAHIASVLAEKSAWSQRVIGISFDGTGWGDDGTIWGGEFFVGSVVEGFDRVLHLRSAPLPGGDGAIRHPVQAAAGFLLAMDALPDLSAAPFFLGERFRQASKLASKRIQTLQTTSMGRLFDVAAALLGFTREMTFEGQAAMWLESLAGSVSPGDIYEFPCDQEGLDFRPLLARLIQDRKSGRSLPDIASAFHRSVANGVARAAVDLCRQHLLQTVVLSGGVFQNGLLLNYLRSMLGTAGVQVWTNSAVPPNDGGVSLGQAAVAAMYGGNHA